MSDPKANPNYQSMNQINSYLHESFTDKDKDGIKASDHVDLWPKILYTHGILPYFMLGILYPVIQAII